MEPGRSEQLLCISRCMGKYAYQIQGSLESGGILRGFRILICDQYNFDSVDVPIEIFDRETIAYLQFRIKLTEKMDIRKLPVKVENNIRAPLGRWLDRWVLENFYGNPSDKKSTNT